jgi:hypothetical protein
VELDNTREGTQKKTTTDLEKRDTGDFGRKKELNVKSKNYSWRP